MIEQAILRSLAKLNKAYSGQVNTDPSYDSLQLDAQFRSLTEDHLTAEVDKVRALMRGATKSDISVKDESILVNILKEQLENAIDALPEGETEFNYNVPVFNSVAMWISFENQTQTIIAGVEAKRIFTRLTSKNNSLMHGLVVPRKERPAPLPPPNPREASRGLRVSVNFK